MTLRIAASVALVALSLTAACSSSDSSDGGSGGTSANGNNPFSKCGSPSGGTGTTPSAACQTLATCEMNACDASYRKCYGDAYASGTFGGACADFISCYAASCNGASCASKLTGDCQTCNDELSKCEEAACTAERTACKGSGGSGGSGGGSGGSGGGSTGKPTTTNCVALSACCGSSAFPAAAKQSCDSLAGLDIDATCQAAVTQYKSAGYCP